MRTRTFQAALIACAVIDVGALAVLILSFFLPLSLLLSENTLSVIFVRAFSAIAVLVLTALLLNRHRVEAFVQKVQQHVRRTVAAEGLEAPALEAPVLHGALMTFAVLIALVAISLAASSPAAYRLFIREDRILEYFSSLSWFGAAACAAAALWVDRRRFPVKSIVYGAMIAFFVVCGGEEISWGQRLRLFEPPGIVTALNKQHEFNLHNIGVISVYANLFFVGTLFCGLIVPLWLKRGPEWRAYLRDRNAPMIDPFAARILGVGLVVWLISGLRFGTLGFSPLSLWGYYTQMDDEIFEFYAAFTFFTLAVLDLRHRLAAKRPMAQVDRSQTASRVPPPLRTTT